VVRRLGDYQCKLHCNGWNLGRAEGCMGRPTDKLKDEPGRHETSKRLYMHAYILVQAAGAV
jgi:hypothetical protein